MDSKMFEKANQILKKTANVHLGVVNENGYPVVVAMSLINPETISEIFLSTTLDSNKAKCLQKNNKASICVSTSTDNITLTGEVEIFTDQETKRPRVNAGKTGFAKYTPAAKSTRIIAYSSSPQITFQRSSTTKRRHLACRMSNAKKKWCANS